MDIEKLPANIDELQSIVKGLASEVSQLTEENSKLKDTILLLRRSKYAPSSEKDPNQLNMFNEVEDIVEDDDEEETEEITYTRRKGKRKPLPPELPRKEVILDIPEEEKEGMKYIGDEVTEKLEIKPAEIFITKTIRKKYAPIEGEGTIKIMDLPPQLLPKSIASSSLIAYIITSKYVDSLPLYRQEKVFERIDASITRQSMSRWLIKVSNQLIPLYNLLQEELLSRHYLQMDETTVQVLKELNKKATSKSYMWVRHAPGEEPIVLYDYAPNRRGAVPLELLEGFEGVLQVDGYDGYAPACEKYKLTRAGCWDHCRRKFYQAFKTSNGKGVGKKGKNLINKLYKIEKDIAMDPPEIKKEKRQAKSVPILNQIKEWVDEIRQKITPDSTAGKAINYCYNEWKYLTAYTNDGQINISNAWVENAIRPFCVGRKNWLFSSSVEGAKASAMFYSLIETAKANGLEPFDYLNKMLDKLPLAESVEDFENLLPLKSRFLATN